MRPAVVPRPCMWSHLPTGSPDWPLPRRRFARCAMWRYASSHACRPSAAAWPSNSPPSATAEADGGTVTAVLASRTASRPDLGTASARAVRQPEPECWRRRPPKRRLRAGRGEILDGASRPRPALWPCVVKMSEVLLWVLMTVRLLVALAYET